VLFGCSSQLLARSLAQRRSNRSRVSGAMRASGAAHLFDALVLGVVWLGMVLLINPVGNFPLNDDWSYGRSVQALLERGTFELTDHTGMTLIAQVAWGAVFSMPGGFSFTALRASTLVLGLIGVLATYGLLREVRVDRRIAMIGALLIATNPLYVVLAFSFMTDVPFFAVSIVALLFLVRGTLRGRDGQLLLGLFFATLALLIRQPALIIFVSFAVAYVVAQGFSMRGLVRAVIPVALGIGVLLGYQQIVRATIGIPAMYNRPYDLISASASGASEYAGFLLDRLFVAALYLGLFLLPYALVVATCRWKAVRPSGWRFSLSATVGLIVAVTGVLWWTDRLMPLSGNVAFDIGLGPPLLRDVYVLGLPNLPSAPRPFWIVVTAAAVTGAILLARHLGAAAVDVARQWRKREWMRSRFPEALAFTTSALYLAFIAVGGYLDRYLLFALPLSMLAVATLVRDGTYQVRPIAWIVSAVLLAAYGFFSVGATHDYLSWNRARWAALNELIDRLNVPYQRIDGGFEFNGWHAYGPQARSPSTKELTPAKARKYVVSFGPLDGYEVVKRYAYRQWIPPETRHILVLRRLDTPATQRRRWPGGGRTPARVSGT
jgi:hypothetical protein